MYTTDMHTIEKVLLGRPGCMSIEKLLKEYGDNKGGTTARPVPIQRLVEFDSIDVKDVLQILASEEAGRALCRLYGLELVRDVMHRMTSVPKELKETYEVLYSDSYVEKRRYKELSRESRSNSTKEYGEANNTYVRNMFNALADLALAFHEREDAYNTATYIYTASRYLAENISWTSLHATQHTNRQLMSELYLRAVLREVCAIDPESVTRLYQFD